MPLLGGPGACRLWRTGLSLSSAGQGQRCPRPVRGMAPWVSGSRRNALVCTVDAIAAFARPPPTDEPALARHCVATHAPCTHSRRQPHRATAPRHAHAPRAGRGRGTAELLGGGGAAAQLVVSISALSTEHTSLPRHHRHSISNFSKFLGSRRDACELLTRDAAAPTHVFTPHTVALTVPGQQPRPRPLPRSHYTPSLYSTL